MRRLMAVFAHPDDESFINTGTIIRAIRDGVQVALVCATLGEEGKTADLCSREELPQVRAEELRAALQVLGIGRLRLLGLRDKQLQHYDRADGVGRVVQAVRELRPHVMYTFSADGWSGHPDHVTVHDWTRAAFRAAGDPAQYPEAGPPWQPQRLYAAISPRTESDRHPIHVRVPVLPYLDTQVAALRCHQTQVPGFVRHVGALDAATLAQTRHTDLWQLLDSTRPLQTGVADDLFTGVVEEP